MSSSGKSAQSWIDVKQHWPSRVNHVHQSVRCTLYVLLGCTCIAFFGSAWPQENQSAQPEQQVPQAAVVTKSATTIGFEVGAGSTWSFAGRSFAKDAPPERR